jgi:hypothetical protein
LWLLVAVLVAAEVVSMLVVGVVLVVLEPEHHLA